MPLGFEFQDGDEIGRVNDCFVFGPFVPVEHTVIGSLCENIETRLDRGIDAELRDATSGLSVPATAKEVE